MGIHTGPLGFPRLVLLGVLKIPGNTYVAEGNFRIRDVTLTVERAVLAAIGKAVGSEKLRGEGAGQEAKGDAQ